MSRQLAGVVVGVAGVHKEHVISSFLKPGVNDGFAARMPRTSLIYSGPTAPPWPKEGPGTGEKQVQQEAGRKLGQDRAVDNE